VYKPTLQRIRTTGGNIGKMRASIIQMGRAIKQGAIYPPIRNFAAKLAARAAPKDFVGQLREIYNHFTSNWRYVMDPVGRELITAGPKALYSLVIAGDGVGVGEGKGVGDCDCVTTALGSLLESVGFPVRLATTADYHAPSGPLFGHVFIQAHVPRVGWITIDPVLHPKKMFGDVAKYSRIAFWDLKGRLLGAKGNVRGLGGVGVAMDPNIPSINEWPDMGLSGVTESDNSGPPIDWEALGPMGFGCLAPQMGIIDGAALAGIGVEVEEEDWGAGTMGARTPMLELSPQDYVYMSFVGKPYSGMLAFGDDGEIYVYDGTLGRGFFKRVFKKIRGAVRKVRKRIKKGIHKLLKRTKFGRFLLKIGGKIKKIAMKIVRPLVKFVGKWASKLAPIAALVPGYGTAIAAGLAAAGKIAKLMQKYGVSTKGKAGQVRGLKLKNPKALPQFQLALKKEAALMSAKAKRNPAAFKQMLAQQKRRLAS
jgi:hypothetical protein